jgi:hypothetical protein
LLYKQANWYRPTHLHWLLCIGLSINARVYDETDLLQALTEVKDRGTADIQEMLEKAEVLSSALNEQSGVELKNRTRFVHNNTHNSVD